MKPILVRGGGDIATGVIHRLYKSGFPVLILESEQPTAIRRKVSFSDAVYNGTSSVEGVTCHLFGDSDRAMRFLTSAKFPEPAMLVDETCECLEEFHPDILIDAILAKENLGTTRDMAKVTIGLGPGFEAGRDVDYVIETMRGHDLGRIIQSGSAKPNTGIPGEIAGYGKERVLHAQIDGIFRSNCEIGDFVEKGQILGYIKRVDKYMNRIPDSTPFPVITAIAGVLRGCIMDGFYVKKGLKIADVDPRREEKKNCFTISDKARCIAGSVLEIVTAYVNYKD